MDGARSMLLSSTGGVGGSGIESEINSHSVDSVATMDLDNDPKSKNCHDARGNSKTTNLLYSQNGDHPKTTSRERQKQPPTKETGRKDSIDSQSTKGRERRTRSSNGMKNDRRPSVDMSHEKPQKETGGAAKFVCEAADQLARLDTDAYRREQQRDIDAVLSQFVLPMSMPWTHMVGRYRVIARDIDELEGIIDAEEEYPGRDRLGAVKDVRVCTMPEYHSVSTRRSSTDPGIIDFVRTRTSQFYDNQKVTAQFGESSQARKRRRIEFLEENTEHLTISLCFGGSSSRSTLRPPGRTSKPEPLVLSAKLPNESVAGRLMRVEGTPDHMRHLGSYDHRHGRPRSSDPTKRIRTGRTRIIWASKESQAPRMANRSILTGSLTDNAKRPADVTVFLRYNGRMLTMAHSHPKTNTNSTDKELAGFRYSSRTVEAAFESADEFESLEGLSALANLQCALNIDAYHHSLGRKGDGQTKLLNRLFSEYFVAVSQNDQMCLSIQPPVIWSQPCEDGVMTVVCTRPGEISGVQYTPGIALGTSVAKIYPWTTAILLDKMAVQYQTCCICWSESEHEEQNDLIVCSSCQVRVHPECYSGRKFFDPKWRCESCLDFEARSSSLPRALTPLNVRWARKCALCDQFRSAVVLRTQTEAGGSRAEWVHSSCLAWERSHAFEKGTCVLCSRESKFLVRCAATGCSLKFHPMCASVASHAAAIHRSTEQTFLHGSLEAEEDRDLFLSTQYCQEAVTLSYGTETDKLKSIPIAYCGLHNPRRAGDRIGLMPGAVFFRDAVRLPPKRS